MAASLTVPDEPKVGDKFTVQGAAFGTYASLTTALAGANNDVKFTAITGGVGGNAVHIVYVDPGGVTAAFSVGVVGNVITFNLARAASVITTVANDIITGVAATAAAVALVSVANAAGNDGTGVVTAMADTPLAGGAEANVEVEIIHASNDQEDVREVFATVNGAFDTTSVLTYTLEQPGRIDVNARVAGVVITKATTEIFTSAG